MKIDKFPGELQRPVVRFAYMRQGQQAYMTLKKVVLTPEQAEWLKRWYPLCSNGELCKASGLTPGELRVQRESMNLQKSERGLRRIHKLVTAAAVRTCKRNGWYDSLRGKRPSDACMEGTRRRWQQVRNGELLSPLATVKKRNPRRYKRIVAKRSADRKEMVRKECMRVVYGLQRQTKIVNVVGCRYTQSQLDHRYNAVNTYGYVLSADNSEEGPDRYRIFYDADTRRSPRFERNLKADGFEILPW